ncbi:MAG: hypothetical protein AAFX99_18320, partial [Myxococcota bacterium]
MIHPNLLDRPGVMATALLGDIHLLQGEPATAHRLYLENWNATRSSDALLGVLTTLPSDSDPDTVQHLQDSLLESILDDHFDPATARVLLRLWLITLLWVVGDQARYAGMALTVLETVPDLTPPLVTPHEAGLSTDTWKASLAALWKLMTRTPEGPARGYMVLKHHHLLACCPHADLRRDLARLTWIGPGAEGAVRVLCLRALDSVALWPLATGVWGNTHRPLRLLDKDEAKLQQRLPLMLRRLIQGIDGDPAERRIVQGRLLEWCTARGDWSPETTRLLESYLRGAEQDRGAKAALEQGQRLAASRGHWSLAATCALRRARLTSDTALQASLVILALEYLRTAPESNTNLLLELAEQLVIPAQGGGRYAQALNRVGFEILEGALIESGNVERLRELWQASGSDHSTQSGTVLARYPERNVEAAAFDMLMGPGPDRWFNKAQGALRRWLLVQSLSNSAIAHEGMLAQLAASPQDSERDLWAVAVTMGFRQTDPDEQHAARARLEQRMEHSDLLLFYVWWMALRQTDPLETTLQQIERLLAGHSQDLGAQVRAALAIDLLEHKQVDMALALARRAFHINPMDAQVRAALRQAAEASDSAQDLDQVRNVVDDVELGRLLKDHDMDLANRYEAIGWELGDDSDSQDHAVEVLEAMSSEVSDERIEAALLRRASEIASGLGLARRAAELSQRAVAARSDDVLALRASLEALVSDQRFAEAADLLIQTSRPFPVSEATATRLVQAAYDLEQNGDDDRAAALYQCAVGGLPRRGDALLDVLDRLGTVLKRRDDAWLWRNILERLLHEDDVAIDLEGELHMRLGHVYQDLLPEPERAAEHLQSALRSPNTRARALEELSAIYGRGDRYDALAQVLRNLIDEPNPGSDKGERKAAYREALAHILSHHLNDPV